MVGGTGHAHHGAMTTSYSPFGATSQPAACSQSHPTLDWAVTPDQRARAEDWLQRAYADGRLTHDDFDRRMGLALDAGTRRELNAAFDGIATIPSTFPGEASRTSPFSAGGYGAAGYGAASASLSTWGTRGALSRQGGTAMGAMAHLSAPFIPLVVPGVIGALSPRGTATHREAAKAFNASLSAIVMLTVLSVLPIPMHLRNGVVGLVWVAWFLASVVGAIKANHGSGEGSGWTHPFTRVLPLRLMHER